MISQITNSLRSAKSLGFRFLGLHSEERHLLIRSAVLLWAVRIGLWVLPFSAIYNAVARHTSSRGMANLSEDRIIWAVKVASGFVPCATCLTQAIAARILLSKYGFGADLCIGVAHDDDKLKAHAWLERDGKVLIGGSICDYRPLPMEGP